MRCFPGPCHALSRTKLSLELYHSAKLYVLDPNSLNKLKSYIPAMWNCLVFPQPSQLSASFSDTAHG